MSLVNQLVEEISKMSKEIYILKIYLMRDILAIDIGIPSDTEYIEETDPKLLKLKIFWNGELAEEYKELIERKATEEAISKNNPNRDLDYLLRRGMTYMKVTIDKIMINEISEDDKDDKDLNQLIGLKRVQKFSHGHANTYISTSSIY